MSNLIRVVYSNREIPKYKMNVLASNECRLFLPVTFTYIDGKMVGMFSTEGYAPLSDYDKLDSQSALAIFSDSVQKMKEAMSRFIFPEDYIFRQDCIFLDRDNSSIRCLFIPGDEENEDILCSNDNDSMLTLEKKYIDEIDSLELNLESLSNILCMHSDEKTCRYIQKALDCITKSRYGIEHALSQVEVLKKEIYMTGIDRKILVREL